MTSSCTIVTAAAILPDFNTLAKSLASSGENPPVISELPPEMAPFTLGKEYTWLSNTIAIALPILSRVSFSQTLAPSAFMVMFTTEPRILSKSSRASIITSPPKGALPPLPAFNAISWYMVSFSSIAFTVQRRMRSLGRISRAILLANIAFTAAVSLLLTIPITGDPP